MPAKTLPKPQRFCHGFLSSLSPWCRVGQGRRDRNDRYGTVTTPLAPHGLRRRLETKHRKQRLVTPSEIATHSTPCNVRLSSKRWRPRCSMTLKSTNAIALMLPALLGARPVRPDPESSRPKETTSQCGPRSEVYRARNELPHENRASCHYLSGAPDNSRRANGSPTSFSPKGNLPSASWWYSFDYHKRWQLSNGRWDVDSPVGHRNNEF